MNTAIENTGERVLIVGGGSGMGLALARQLLSEGAEVTIAGRSEAKLDEAKTSLGDPSSLHVAIADIAKEDEVGRLFADIGRLDHIVSTAADIGASYRLLPDLDIAEARRVVDSKFFGPLLLAKHGVPALSVKGSITSLVRALAVELGPVRVNAVSPGWVDTPIWQHVAGDAKAAALDAMAARLPVGRIGRPEDIADAIRFLMRNGFVTGTVLHAEGGHRLV